MARQGTLNPPPHDAPVDPTTDAHTPARPLAPAPAGPSAGGAPRMNAAGRAGSFRQAVQAVRVTRVQACGGTARATGSPAEAAAPPGRGDYVREARRVRATWAAKPGRMHRHLGELSRRRDLAVHSAPVAQGKDSENLRPARPSRPGPSPAPAAKPAPDRQGATAPTPAAEGGAGDSFTDLLGRVFDGSMDIPRAAEGFARSVAEAMEGGSVLRYSRRAALLRQAETQGIGRFEANLIIAAVQHREAARGLNVSSERPPAAGGRHSREQRTLRRGGYALALAGFLLVQSLIVVGFWHILKS